MHRSLPRRASSSARFVLRHRYVASISDVAFTGGLLRARNPRLLLSLALVRLLYSGVASHFWRCRYQSVFHPRAPTYLFCVHLHQPLAFRRAIQKSKPLPIARRPAIYINHCIASGFWLFIFPQCFAPSIVSLSRKHLITFFLLHLPHSSNHRLSALKLFIITLALFAKYVYAIV